MVWVLEMKLDIEWGGDAFDGKSPPVASWAAIPAPYRIQTKTLHLTHVAHTQIC